MKYHYKIEVYRDKSAGLFVQTPVPSWWKKPEWMLIYVYSSEALARKALMDSLPKTQVTNAYYFDDHGRENSDW